MSARKILAAVDGSIGSMRALDYLCMMAAKSLADCRVTLLNVPDCVPAALRREAVTSRQALLCMQAMIEKAQEKGSEVLDRARRRMKRQGFSESRLESKLRGRSAGLAKDILLEARHGGYHALVVGRRGLSAMQKLLLGSVTNKVVQHGDRVPVWVVGGKVAGDKILCALDCSREALRAVEHLAFMLDGGSQTDVSFFHAGADLGLFFDSPCGEEEGMATTDLLEHAGQREYREFCEQASSIMEQAGFDPGRVTVISAAKVRNVAQAILQEVKTGGYGTVVLGRRGESQSFWLGHVSDKVINSCRDAAVWVVG